MSDRKPTPLEPLEKNKLWKEACGLADYFYGTLNDFPANERYTTVSKIRIAVADLLFSLSQGLGNPSDSGREYDWSAARKYASGLKGIYIFAGKQKIVELEPEIIVRIDRLCEAIDQQVEQGYKDTNAAYKREIEAWKDRYESWKKLSKETNPEWMTGSK